MRHSHDPVLFDIRLNNLEEDVLVIKGSPDEAPSVFLAGTIVLSLSEPIQINRLKLQLVGEMNMKIFEQPNSKTNHNYSRFKKRLFQHKWDDIDIDSCVSNMHLKNVPTNKLTDNRRILLQKAKSSTSLATSFPRERSSSTKLFGSIGVSHRNDITNKHTTLVKGNYEFPFSAILPGTLPESVEGLPNANVIYKLKAKIERTKNDMNISTEKHFRVVRTISPDTAELSETVAVDNTWPEKVEYSISIPAKTVAIGSSIPISLSLVPLLKKLKLGQVKAALVENSQYCGHYGIIHNQEREICRIKLKDPMNHMQQAEAALAHTNGDEPVETFNFQDKWEVQTVLQIPPTLSKCSQDCTVLKNIKVRHKLKFVIYLINPDGHVSQLRASLPVQLFLSPFIAITVRNVEPQWVSDQKDRLVNTYSSSGLNNLYHEKNKNNEDDDRVIFSRAASGIDITNIDSNDTNPSQSNQLSRAELMVPPQYEKYIYDRVFSPESSTVNSPMTSGMHSPILRSRGASFVASGGFEGGFTPLALQSLNFNRTEPETSRDINFYSSAFSNSRRSSLTPDVAQPLCILNNQKGKPPLIPNINSSTSISSKLHSSNPFFTDNNSSSQLNIRNLNISETQAMPTSPLINEATNNDRLASPPPNWEPKELNKVPTYDVAMKITAIGNELPPAYPEEEANSIHHLESPKSAKFKSESYTNLMSRNHKKNTTFSVSPPTLRTNSSNLAHSKKETLLSHLMDDSSFKDNNSPNSFNNGSSQDLRFGIDSMQPQDKNIHYSEFKKKIFANDEDMFEPKRSSSLSSFKGLFGRKT